MLQTLTFATNNQHKLSEAKTILKSLNITIKSLADNNISIDIPEPYHTFEENSAHKVKTIYDTYHIDCFAEDAGLEISALNNEPGVLSARYAGDHDDEKNILKVLENIQGKEKRDAKFVAVISLIIEGELHQFRGECLGTIAQQRDEKLSFGYDPIFIPQGYTQPFSQLGEDIKSKVSHRKNALDKMVDFLKNKNIK